MDSYPRSLQAKALDLAGRSNEARFKAEALRSETVLSPPPEEIHRTRPDAHAMHTNVLREDVFRLRYALSRPDHEPARGRARS